jgi:hemerythrin superfamily protein
VYLISHVALVLHVPGINSVMRSDRSGVTREDRRGRRSGMTAVEQRDLIEVLTRDHREVEQMFAELEQGTGDPRRRRMVADAVIAELVRHAVAEEEYLYPTARKVLPDGNPLADREIAEHAEAERIMKELEDVEPIDPEFDRLARLLIQKVRHHMQEEEADLFPRLRQACPEDELRRLGRKVEVAKKMAPTRPHPDAPDTPPWNKLVAPGAGLVDRIRDVISGRATSAEDL